MNAKAKKTTRRKAQTAPYQAGAITFLIALIAALTIILLAYFGVILSA